MKKKYSYKNILYKYIIYIHCDDVYIKFLASIFQVYLKITLHFLNDISFFSHIRKEQKKMNFKNIKKNF